MSLDTYTDQQSRFADAFSFGGSCCTAHCEACGRTYFVTSQGNGDYEEGELERLRERAKTDDKVIEVPDFSSVPTAIDPATGKEIVVGCLCKAESKFCDWLEARADQIATYLGLYFRAKHAEARRAFEEAERKLCELAEKDFPGGQPIKTAPKDGSWVQVKLRDGRITEAHWASVLSGEDQPPFEGWFEATGSERQSYRQVDPIAWRPLPKRGDDDRD